MRKHLFISVCFVCLFSQIGPAQNWVWSKKINQPIPSSFYYNTGGLFADKNGNVYSYRSSANNRSYYNFETDTIGSFLQGYSPDGVLLFTKHWKIPFHIHKIEYDGNNAFYFAATFYGTHTINNITIKSRGQSDGVIGKMDLRGNILWMKTFGGGKMDGAFSICFNSSNNSICATGDISDTLFFNNQFQSAQYQSAIMIRYSPEGSLIQYRLYDFLSQAMSSGHRNTGREISLDKEGNYFVLLDRDGRHWSTDTLQAPMKGHYATKLNANLDTLWSTYIIGPTCYYGFDCNSLKVAANGDAYISRECSGKYGGNAELLRLNGSTGKISWRYDNNDGFYNDLFIDNNIVCLIGTEGANGCPCEFSNRGYQVIKKIDENNVVLGETRISAGINNITKDVLGNIFISGAFVGKSVSLGPDVLTADSTLYYGSSYNYYAHFLSKLNDINCLPPIISASTNSSYGHYYPICPGDTTILSVNLTEGKFLWSNGATGPKTSVGKTGFYSVMNEQANGCKAYSLPTQVLVNENNNSYQMCLVTLDSVTNKNKITVSYVSGIRVNLYKNVEGTIIPVSSNDANLYSYGTIFIDTSSNPNSGYEDYYISTVNDCGDESGLSAMHRSIFLEVNKENDKKTLAWNTYIGTPVTGYRIWRGMSTGNLILFDSVDASTTNYTDPNISSEKIYYQVEAINSNHSYRCYVAGKFYRSSKSNIGNYNGVVLNISSASIKNAMNIFPNPTEGVIHINYFSNEKNALQLNIVNIRGQKVYSETISRFQSEYNKVLDMSMYAKGIYYIEIIGENTRQVKRVALN